MDVLTESYSLPLDYARRIWQVRQGLGLSQQQFADLIGVSLHLLQQIIRTKTEGISALQSSPGAFFLRERRITYTSEPEVPPFLDFSADQESCVRWGRTSA